MSKKASWLSALQDQALDVQSARDALQVKGWLDTGNYALNWALSGRLQRGYPLGHTGEIYGDPGTGKSYLAARAIAMAQARGGVALLDDAEGAYNAEHAGRVGVNVDALGYARSHTVKNHLGVTQGFLKAFQAMKPAPECGILVLDSLAQLSTEHELESGLDKRDMSKAPELKSFYRQVGHDIFELPVIHMATNHTIATIGNPFQSRSTPGGGGPKFTASWRLDLRSISKIKQGADIIGVICRAVVDKNRIVAPWKETRLAIPFHQPISKASGLVDLLVALGILTAVGNFLYYQSQKVGRFYKGKEKFLEQDNTGEALLDKYPEILDDADKALENGQVRKVMGEDADAVTVGMDDAEEE